MRTLSALLLSFSLFLCNSATALAKPDFQVQSNLSGVLAVTIDINQQINDDTAKTIIDKINAVEKNGNIKEVWFRINTPGGSLAAGSALIDKIEELSKTTKTVCVADHYAASMGFIILQSCDVRAMTKRTVLLAHEIQSMEEGNSHDLRREADFMDALNRAIAEFVVARMNMPVEEYLSKIYNKNWILSWEDGLKYNAVDQIVDQKDIPISLELPQN
jgi:ATP-dependent Clp protease, protease subunit